MNIPLSEALVDPKDFSQSPSRFRRPQPPCGKSGKASRGAVQAIGLKREHLIVLCPVVLNHAEPLEVIKARIHVGGTSLDELTQSLAFVWIHEMGHYILNSM